jgi:ketosteroid isomerase-like protein
MIESATATIVRSVYEAYSALDIAKIDALMAPGFVMHVSGHHPLSGDRSTRDDVWAYLGKVAEISGGKGGYEVHAITTDESGHGIALLTGTIRDFVRPVIHIWHVRDGQVTEFWDSYLDAAAEDAFWATAHDKV